MGFLKGERRLKEEEEKLKLLREQKGKKIKRRFGYSIDGRGKSKTVTDEGAWMLHVLPWKREQG